MEILELILDKLREKSKSTWNDDKVYKDLIEICEEVLEECYDGKD